MTHDCYLHKKLCIHLRPTPRSIPPGFPPAARVLTRCEASRLPNGAGTASCPAGAPMERAPGRLLPPWTAARVAPGVQTPSERWHCAETYRQRGPPVVQTPHVAARDCVPAPQPRAAPWDLRAAVLPISPGTHPLACQQLLEQLAVLGPLARSLREHRRPVAAQRGQPPPRGCGDRYEQQQ